MIDAFLNFLMVASFVFLAVALVLALVNVFKARGGEDE